MISDRERTRLLEIEQQIQTEDPDFARSFEPTRASHRRHCRRWWLYTAATVFTLLMSLITLLAGLPVGALLLHTGTWALVMARRDHATSVPKKYAAQCTADGSRLGTSHEVDPHNGPQGGAADAPKAPRRARRRIAPAVLDSYLPSPWPLY